LHRHRPAITIPQITPVLKTIIMKKFSLHFFIAGSIIYLLACNTASDKKGTTASSDTAAFDLSAVRAQIEKDNTKFSEEIRRGDTAAVQAHYASDGWFMVNNKEPIRGNDIASAWGEFIRMGMKDLRLTTVDLIGNTDLLVETGTYEMYGDANKLLDKGKYVVVWKRENGAWKIYRDIGNSNLPATPVK
jgi:ketosteroid isomerase-like protein